MGSAGRIITDVDGNVLGADETDNNQSASQERLQTADLVNDRSIFCMNEFESPSQYDIDLLREDYDYAWNNWPAAWGAPYEDVNNDGVYDPNVDIPGYPGADQTIWIVANDVPQIVDANGIVIDIINTAPESYGANPIGIELQITLWAYELDADAPLGNTIFKKASMKYFGLPETLEDALLDSVYFTQWSDPDLENGMMIMSGAISTHPWVMHIMETTLMVFLKGSMICQCLRIRFFTRTSR